MPSTGSTKIASWIADHQRKSLWPTSAATSPSTQTIEIKFLDAAGGVRNTALDVVEHDLHDLRLVLDDVNLGRLGEFAGGVAEAVLSHERVGVDDEDDVAEAYRAAVARP
jgi:hypothetical protein